MIFRTNRHYYYFIESYNTDMISSKYIYFSFANLSNKNLRKNNLHLNALSIRQTDNKWTILDYDSTAHLSLYY